MEDGNVAVVTVVTVRPRLSVVTKMLVAVILKTARMVMS